MASWLAGCYPPSTVQRHLIANGKPDQRIFSRRFGLGGDVRDVRIHLELDRCEKRVELVGVTFGHKLDPAVRKVANVARNLKTPASD